MVNSWLFNQDLHQFGDASAKARQKMKEGIAAAGADLKKAMEEGVDVKVGEAVDVTAGKQGVDVVVASDPASNSGDAADTSEVRREN